MRQGTQSTGVVLLAFGVGLGTALSLLVLGLEGSIWKGMAAGVLVLALTVSLLSMRAALYALMVAALLEGLYKAIAPSLGTMLLKDVFLVLMLLQLFWHSQANKDYSWLSQPFTASAVLFVTYCVAMMFAPSTRSVLLALAGVRAWVLWMPVYFPAWALFKTTRQIASVLTFIIALELPVCVYGIIQGNIGFEHLRAIPAFYAQTRWYRVSAAPPDETSPGIEEGFRPVMSVRATSIYNNPHDLGNMAAATVLLSLGMLAYARGAGLRVLSIVTALAGAGGVLAAGSRAPVLGLFFGLVAMTLVTRRRGMIIAGILLIVVAGLYQLRDIAGSGAERIQRELSLVKTVQRTTEPLVMGWQQGVAHPLGNGVATGVGSGRLFESEMIRAGVRETRWVENEFGRALTELGFLGTALWLYMLFRVLGLSAGSIWSMGLRREAVLGAGMFGLMTCVFVQLAVGSALYLAHAGLYFWIFAAAIIRLGDLVREERAAEGEGGAQPPVRLVKRGFVMERVPVEQRPPVAAAGALPRGPRRRP